MLSCFSCDAAIRKQSNKQSRNLEGLGTKQEIICFPTVLVTTAHGSRLTCTCRLVPSYLFFLGDQKDVQIMEKDARGKLTRVARDAMQSFSLQRKHSLGLSRNGLRDEH